MKQSLQRTRKMMAEQLARVAQVSEVMGEQDALLRHTFDEHQVRWRWTVWLRLQMPHFLFRVLIVKALCAQVAVGFWSRK